ncbi:MAG: hypothetical protein V1919_05100 [Candidatus Omnitrophota bacterium]
MDGQQLELFFDIIKCFLFAFSPVLLIVGVILLSAEHKYRKLEEILGREIGGIKKMVFPKLEVTVYTFQERLLNGRILLGWLFFIFSFVFLAVAFRIRP